MFELIRPKSHIDFVGKRMLWLGLSVVAGAAPADDMSYPVPVGDLDPTVGEGLAGLYSSWNF